MIQTKEERIEELRRSVELLRSAALVVDRARDLYLGEHQAHDYGSPVSRLLNVGMQFTAVTMLIEEEIERMEKE